MPRALGNFSYDMLLRHAQHEIILEMAHFASACRWGLGTVCKEVNTGFSQIRRHFSAYDCFYDRCSRWEPGTCADDPAISLRSDASRWRVTLACSSCLFSIRAFSKSTGCRFSPTADFF